MKELEQYQKTEAYKVFNRKTQDRQKGKSHRQGIRTKCSLSYLLEYYDSNCEVANGKDVFLLSLCCPVFT